LLQSTFLDCRYGDCDIQSASQCLQFPEKCIRSDLKLSLLFVTLQRLTVLRAIASSASLLRGGAGRFAAAGVATAQKLDEGTTLSLWGDPQLPLPKQLFEVVSALQLEVAIHHQPHPPQVGGAGVEVGDREGEDWVLMEVREQAGAHVVRGSRAIAGEWSWGWGP
jgi:hypothetical protein